MNETMMYILLAIIAVLTVAEIVMAALVIAWRMKLNEEADSMHRYTELIKNLWEFDNYRTNLIAKDYDEQSKMYREFCDFGQEVCKQYRDIIYKHDDIITRYNSMAEQHNKLLECWKHIEERYSSSYEQFKLCADKLKELSYQITDLANVSTDDEYYLTLQEACDTVCIDCPYDECRCENCPVREIQHRDISVSEPEEEDDNDPWETKCDIATGR